MIRLRAEECYVGALSDATETSLAMSASTRQLDFLVGVSRTVTSLHSLAGPL